MLGSSRLRSQRPAPARPSPLAGGPTGPAPIRPTHLPASFAAQNAPGGRKRILFLCIGNSCRSQMAEAFAKAYGSDIFEAHSAGLAPAPLIAPLTKHVLALRGIPMDGHFPKGLEDVLHQPFDIIVNMTGQPVRLPAGRILDWPVRDPIGLQESVYRDVAAQIEDRVMRLILETRAL